MTISSLNLNNLASPSALDALDATDALNALNALNALDATDATLASTQSQTSPFAATSSFAAKKVHRLPESQGESQSESQNDDAFERQRQAMVDLTTHGLYDPNDERDSCGVGLVASINGQPSRKVVLAGLEALRRLSHRGAVDADGKTGDGAGIMMQIPQMFFRQKLVEMGVEDCNLPVAVGMVFLPKLDFGQQMVCRQVIEREVIDHGFKLLGWRQVPIQSDALGETANSTKPEIEQVLIIPRSWVGAKASEITITQEVLEGIDEQLYRIRRRIEKTLLEQGVTEASFCSFSCRSIVYKGLCLADQLAHFYVDINDSSFTSNFIIYHQRYSTNTFPSWRLAQPFYTLAHNGEINTVQANLHHLRRHEMGSLERFADDASHLFPIALARGSDSLALDAMVEFMVRQRRSLPDTLQRLMPTALLSIQDTPGDQALHASFQRYIEALYEPWDGPASLCAFGGRWVVARLDRQGLRPARYGITSDGLLVVGSEVGMTEDNAGNFVEHGQLGPGKMIGVDLVKGELVRDTEFRLRAATASPFASWQQGWLSLTQLPSVATSTTIPNLGANSSLTVRHIDAGWTHEDVQLVLHPSAATGKEPIGSMGDDSPLAVFSGRYRGLHHFFRQNFAQVTNPSIDSLRERCFMSLRTFIGTPRSCLLPESVWDNVVEIATPILTLNDYQRLKHHFGATWHHLRAQAALPSNMELDAERDLLPQQSGHILSAGVKKLQDQAEAAVRAGAVVLSIDVGATQANVLPIPSILALGAVQRRLNDCGLQNRCHIVCVADDVLDCHSVAVLIGLGACAVVPTLAMETIIDRFQRGLFKGTSHTSADPLIQNYVTSLCDGLLKIMAKSGIAAVSSYRGGHFFEIIGLSRAMAANVFPGMISRISGLGSNGLGKKLLAIHLEAFPPHGRTAVIPIGGFYQQRQQGERHAWDANSIHLLQTAVDRGSYALYEKYVASLAAEPAESNASESGAESGANALNNVTTDAPHPAKHQLAAVNLRQVLQLRAPDGRSIHLNEVTDSISSIRRRLVAPAISLGALSPIAHETLAIAMNRIGSRSNCGEGGEDPVRFNPNKDGDNACSAIKQVASARFGVTAEYLNNCSEIEIKIAQGAKPGEGGHLPGIKVSSLIARLRYATQGVTLISPPPHHDIYSIEDLAQLIYDLKQINPKAEIGVKLVARGGIGPIAAGVAKAGADVILISGHVGGTGASPLTSIKFAGAPWEMGLAETHQVLTLNRLRQRIKLRVDGGIRSGREVVVAAILGAEEFGVGTAGLVAMGCLMVRQCHSNTCPVGVCTQNEELIERFRGTPEKVINLFTFIAEDVRQILASLGVPSLDAIIGQTQYLSQVSRGRIGLDDLDLNPLLVKPDIDNKPLRCTRTAPNPVARSLDEDILRDIQPLFSRREKMLTDYKVHNGQRAIGTRIAGYITRQYGMDKLDPGHLTLRLRGYAGQSLGAFAVQGMHIDLAGAANDYVGKGLSGGVIVVRPDSETLDPNLSHAIIGNTALYGATRGALFAAGRAGERFGVRNSGAVTVVEGCGANACEYMTGGAALILGSVGPNFGAGMTGGMAYIYDPDETVAKLINPENIGIYAVDDATIDHDSATYLWELLATHVRLTGSARGQDILNRRDLRPFRRIIPHEIVAAFKRGHVMRLSLPAA